MFIHLLQSEATNTQRFYMTVVCLQHLMPHEAQKLSHPLLRVSASLVSFTEEKNTMFDLIPGYYHYYYYYFSVTTPEIKGNKVGQKNKGVKEWKRGRTQEKGRRKWAESKVQPATALPAVQPQSK